MPRTRLLAMLVAGCLGAALPVACGSVGDRNNIERSNQGQDVPKASSGTTETNPVQLTPTGQTQPSVTQPPTTSPTVPGQGDVTTP